MIRKKTITVKGVQIAVTSENEENYICLTDMVKDADDGDQLIKRWLSTRNTVEFLGIWEGLKNPGFNLSEFRLIKNEAGSNKFSLSVKQWVTKTNGIGLSAKTGRYGSGTYAHTDIALKFAGWISPEFELLILIEFQRLKKEEASIQSLEWDQKRFLSKVNYKIHTDAIKKSLLPTLMLAKEDERFIYASEAELLNMAVLNTTSQKWRAENPSEVLQGRNIRDMADGHELLVFANMESLNAAYIADGLSAKERLIKLRSNVITQLESLRSGSYTIARIQSPFKSIETSG